MKPFVENEAFLLAITFILYYGVLLLQRKYNSVLLNPVLITVLVLISYLIIFGISPEKYEEAGKYIDFWLKPSIVALGVPLYLQLSKIRKQLIPLVLSQFVGSLVGVLTVCLVAKWLGLEDDIAISLAPKSVTTPIALEVSRMLNGIEPITVMAVMTTGFLGNLFGITFLNWFRIKSPMAKGISLGTASHALGIMAAFNLSEKYAVYASLGMIFNGIFTAVLAPPVVHLLF
ncbi:LrgB family protein [Capnocytophaga ochracea DSM 7271]|jgi:lrgB family protein|uniref:LrgB family protein n=1 Tax=Capnocytophaga ochracea (strain ATCC 27872 / DSM 7271 / CCUG 9716 / JCM 12966 / NCTC 12371 / SS31 / VPI 2845) TaxID=521097 RepID=C7M4K9_CAPOD|nr:LrgB family protein [Capnocytophaga ochracea]ACU91639.1 LrgB family protein [Capnocytophaga ochracea DSM 7271]UAK50418.1 LrgB family protein [Capnocytophaga ochracea]